MRTPHASLFHRKGRDFPPSRIASPGSKTTMPTAKAPGGGASPPNCASRSGSKPTYRPCPLAASLLDSVSAADCGPAPRPAAARRWHWIACTRPATPRHVRSTTNRSTGPTRPFSPMWPAPTSPTPAPPSGPPGPVADHPGDANAEEGWASGPLVHPPPRRQPTSGDRRLAQVPDRKACWTARPKRQPQATRPQGRPESGGPSELTTSSPATHFERARPAPTGPATPGRCAQRSWNRQASRGHGSPPGVGRPRPTFLGRGTTAGPKGRRLWP